MRPVILSEPEPGFPGEVESKDPENASSAMPIRGILPNLHVPRFSTCATVFHYKFRAYG